MGQMLTPDGGSGYLAPLAMDEPAMDAAEVEGRSGYYAEQAAHADDPAWHSPQAAAEAEAG